MGYLSQVKSKGRRYIYLSEYVGGRKYTNSTDMHVYGFGEKNKALEKMKVWEKEYPYKFPRELLERGYGRHDLKQWINTLETGQSKTGRSKKFV